MRHLLTLLIFTVICTGKETPLLKAYYTSSSSEGINYHNFTVENLTKDEIIMSHLNSSTFRWQVNLEDNKPWLFSTVIAKYRTEGYAILGVKKANFILSSNTTLIRGEKGTIEDSYLLLKACKLKDFKESGFESFKLIKIPLSKSQ